MVVGGREAALAFRLFEGLGRERFACDLVLACAGGGVLPGLDAAEEQAVVERAARRRGAVFSRAGNGPGHQVYVSRFAAPGRVALGVDPRLAACGALGTLAFAVNPVELAVALAGVPVEIVPPEVVIVRLIGRPPGWLGGEDLVLALRRRFGVAPPRGAVLEFHPLETDAIPVAARIAIARECPALGATSALFPSDETTRRFLKAQGREADWKPLAVIPEGATAGGLDLDLSDLEPLIERAGSGEVLPLREMAGASVDAVWMGPEVTAADLVRLAALLGARPVDPRVALTVTIGNRQVHETAARDGVLATLHRAGARVGVEADGRPPAVRAGTGTALACGVGGARWTRADMRRWHVTGLDACAAAALAGTIGDPRVLVAPESGEAAVPVLNDRLLVRPPSDTPGAAPEPGTAEPVFGAAIEGPMRGTVLLKLGDRVGVDTILPWGARVRPLRLKLGELARFAFAGVDPGFAARAAAHGGGWIVAGHGFGAGGRREQVGLVAVRLGLKAVLARSFDPGFRRLLLQHGILALRLAADGDYEDLVAGDELEIPDLPEGLEAGKPLVVRNLTRGEQHALHHDLDATAIAAVRIGGLLAAARLRPHAVTA